MLVDHLLETERIQKFKETGDSQYIYQNEPQSCTKYWRQTLVFIPYKAQQKKFNFYFARVFC